MPYPANDGSITCGVRSRSRSRNSVGANRNMSWKVSVKCDPDLADDLRRSYPDVAPGYHLNKRHWNTVTCNASVPDRLVKDMIEDSYDLVTK